MQANRNDLASIITLEAGKPFKEALGEVRRTPTTFCISTYILH